MVDFTWLISISFKDLLSRKTRTILTVLGIAVGIALLFSLVALVSGMESQSASMIRRLTSADITVRNTTLSEFTGPTGVAPIGGFRQMQRSSSYINESVLSFIQGLSGVYAVTPVLTVYASLNNSFVALQGIVPSEYQLVTGSLNIVDGEFFSCMDCPEAVIGKALADRLNITVGDNVTLTVNETQMSLRVTGIYESGLQFFEATNIYVPLNYLQSVTGVTGAFSEILVKLENPSFAQDVASTIQSMYPDLRAIVQTTQIQQVTQVLSTLSMFFITIGLIAIIAGGFGVANTMLINVFERTREIGILRAIGASSRTILLLFLVEAVLFGLMGGVTGIAIGLLLAHVLPSYFPLQTASRVMPGARSLSSSLARVTINPLITWENVVFSMVLGVCVSLIAGLYPAWRASRVKPAEVLRHA
ncbi:MAG: FtsX-like permease family protein [Desulfurococcaceae archaeon]